MTPTPSQDARLDGPGHVYVVRGDVTAIACDWWLLPVGTDLATGDPGHVMPHWRGLDSDLDDRLALGWHGQPPDGSNRAVVLREPQANAHPGIIAVHSGETGNEPASWFGDLVPLAIRQLRLTRYGPRPLVAFPLLGTGAGGGGPRRAGVLEALLEGSLRACQDGPDVALVVANKQAFSAAQRYRAQSPERWWDFDREDERWTLAEELASHGREGNLVPFIGAGVSQEAGLDSWGGLLAKLAKKVGIEDENDLEALHALEPRDAGRLLDLEFGNETGVSDAIREMYADKHCPSLTHYLLASLPIREAATTNYDTLFEDAWAAAVTGPGDRAARAEAVRVMPRQSHPAARWLVKLHGDVRDTNRQLVLSRDEYARLETTGSALTGLLQALLLTRHLLIVGYGLQDETFHRVAHDIRAVTRNRVLEAVARDRRDHRFGTVLVVKPPGLADRLWIDDLRMHHSWRDSDPEDNVGPAARRQNILLDLVAHLASPSEAYLLGDGYLQLSEQEPDRSIRDLLFQMKGVSYDSHLSPGLDRAIKETIARFGG